MAKFVCYDSEDEGFRFPVGKTHPTLERARTYVEKRLAREHKNHESEVLYRSRKQLTAKQVEGAGEPNCHGALVGMYARPWEDGWKPLDDKRNLSSAYAYDWVFIYRV
jgi:hypothetical protein